MEKNCGSCKFMTQVGGWCGMHDQPAWGCDRPYDHAEACEQGWLSACPDHA